MPAPQPSMMKQLARLKFSQNGLKVPDKWQAPSGDPAAKHYSRAFKPGEQATSPDTVVPPLFLPHSMNKYHTDTQKKLNNVVGTFLDGIVDAICSTWSTWQSSATMVGILINAVSASLGQVVGPPWTPMILAQGPKSTPQQLRYTTAVANVLGTGWTAYTASIKVPGLPWYPLFAAVPSLVAPPTPNIPTPIIALTQVTAPLSASTMKNMMCAALGDPTAMYHKEIFDAVCDAFEKCFQLWQTTTMVTKVLGTGGVPTFAPPIAPAGPVVAGIGTMIPGGFT